MINNEKKNAYLTMILRLTISFFVVEYLQFFVICYFRFKFEWTPRIFTLNKIILSGQLISLLFIGGQIGAFFQLYDAILNEPA
jgi:glucan phosphoethanolaminetransferase (alkaline phosphatase superfamily)